MKLKWEKIKYYLKNLQNGQNVHLLTEKQFPSSAFKWFTKFSKIITPFIKTQMESLTWNDHETIKESL